jgi:ferric-dicitrate binding protein FerR (iron transport regulator)
VSELGSGQGNSTLRLERGRVLCKIAHRPQRTFSVLTSDLRVVDVGTVFSVSVEPPSTSPGTVVRVIEGEVMVHHAGNATRVTAQQSFSSVTPVAPEPAPQLEPEARPDARGAARAPSRRPLDNLDEETELLRRGLLAERQGDLRGAAQAFEKLVKRYPSSPLVPDARAALARVKGRLESSR